MSGCFKKSKIPIGLSPFRFIIYRIPHSGIDFRDGITDPSVPFFLFSAHKIARKPTTKKHTLRLKDNHLQAYMRFMQKSGRKPKTIVVPTAKISGHFKSYEIPFSCFCSSKTKKQRFKYTICDTAVTALRSISFSREDVTPTSSMVSFMPKRK